MTVGEIMPENIVRERGKRAGNVLLIGAIISVALSVIRSLIDLFSEAGSEDTLYFLLDSIGGVVVFFVIFMLLVNALKDDRIKSTRTFSIVLCAVSALELYFAFSGRRAVNALLALSNTAVYALALIALYKLGKAGKICCYFASALSVVSLLLSFADEEFMLADFVLSAFMVIFYVFLGLYVESKGMPVEEPVIISPAAAPPVRAAGPGRGDYDELERLKELMDKGVITPGEYEAKKKQILGL